MAAPHTRSPRSLRRSRNSLTLRKGVGTHVVVPRENWFPTGTRLWTGAASSRLPAGSWFRAQHGAVPRRGSGRCLGGTRIGVAVGASDVGEREWNEPWERLRTALVTRHRLDVGVVRRWERPDVEDAGNVPLLLRQASAAVDADVARILAGRSPRLLPVSSTPCVASRPNPRRASVSRSTSASRRPGSAASSLGWRVPGWSHGQRPISTAGCAGPRRPTRDSSSSGR